MPTKREMEVLAEVEQGKTNREIAEDLCITESTVKQYVHHLLTAYDVNNRTKLSKILTKEGLS